MPPPRARVCPICGRQCLLPSFEFHYTQCRDLFEKREALKPPKERRQAPVAARLTGGPGPGHGHGHGTSLEQANDAAFQSFNDGLLPCSNCGRTFLPEKLGIHQRSCRSKPVSGVAALRTVHFAATPMPPNASQNVQSYSYDDRSTASGISRTNSGTSQSQSTTKKTTAGGIAMRLPPAPDYSDIPSDYAELMRCPSCGRQFNEFSYQKHVKICKKVFVQKRKPYDSAKHRAEGTELAAFRKPKLGARYSSGTTRMSSTTMSTTATATATATMTSSQLRPSAGAMTSMVDRQQRGASQLPKWKADSLAFRQAMREAKLVSRAEVQSKKTGVPLHMLLPPPRAGGGGGGYPSTTTDFATAHYVLCPTCGRKFNESAGARHIPQCKNIIAKPKALAKGSGTNAAGVSMFSTTPHSLSQQNHQSLHMRKPSGFEYDYSYDYNYQDRDEPFPQPTSVAVGSRSVSTNRTTVARVAARSTAAGTTTMTPRRPSNGSVGSFGPTSNTVPSRSPRPTSATKSRALPAALPTQQQATHSSIVNSRHQQLPQPNMGVPAGAGRASSLARSNATSADNPFLTSKTNDHNSRVRTNGFGGRF